MKLDFEDTVHEPTVTVVAQYPNMLGVISSKIRYIESIDEAVLQATFAIKEQLELKAQPLQATAEEALPILKWD